MYSAYIVLAQQLCGRACLAGVTAIGHGAAARRVPAPEAGWPPAEVLLVLLVFMFVLVASVAVAEYSGWYDRLTGAGKRQAKSR